MISFGSMLFYVSLEKILDDYILISPVVLRTASYTLSVFQ